MFKRASFSNLLHAAAALALLLLCAAPVSAQVLGAPNSTQTQIGGQNADHVAFTGGTIDGVTLGSVTPATWGTACTSTGATPQTCNGLRGVATSGTLTTAAATAASYVINNSSVTATSVVQCELQGYSGTYVTNGTPLVLDCKAGAGTITVDFINIHASNALNGTLKFGFTVF